MRQIKIRGHKRRKKHIEDWRLKNLEIRHDLLERDEGDHLEIVVHPWCDISLINSTIPSPKGKTKQLMLNGLLDIYDSWKKQLDKLGQPYYLKIWLFDPRFSLSQVVCAVGEKITYYDDNFYKPEIDKVLRLDKYGNLKDRLEKFNWTYQFDEENYNNNEVGEPELYLSRQDYEYTKSWFEKLMKKQHRTTKYNETTELYSFKLGDLWTGESKY